MARAAGFILAMGASYYVGAMIGSAAVETYKAVGFGGGASATEVVAWARSQGIDSTWLAGLSLVMKIFLDRSFLLIVAVVCAVLAALFWSSFGPHAFEVFSVVFGVYLLVENYVLRQYIKQLRDKG